MKLWHWLCFLILLLEDHCSILKSWKWKRKWFSFTPVCKTSSVSFSSGDKNLTSSSCFDVAVMSFEKQWKIPDWPAVRYCVCLWFRSVVCILSWKLNCRAEYLRIQNPRTHFHTWREARKQFRWWECVTAWYQKQCGSYSQSKPYFIQKTWTTQTVGYKCLIRASHLKRIE